MSSLVDFIFPASAELFMLLAICAILLVSVFKQTKSDLIYYLAQLSLVLSAYLTWHVYIHNLTTHQTSVAYSQGFILDELAVFLKMLIFISAFATFMYSRSYNIKFKLPQSDFYILCLFSILGMMVLVSAYNFLTLYLGLELMSLPLYALIALQKHKRRCVESSIKYFIVGAVASGLLLYGLSILFGLTGTVDLVTVADFSLSSTNHEWIVLLFAMVFIVAGAAFKMGVAPFHMWVPDVYDGAPNSVTLFLSGAPKVAAFGLMLRVLIQAMPTISFQWHEILIVISILSMAIGNIAAIIQTNIKRMLAFSSIAHGGYMLLGLICATSRGYSAALFYMITYMLMSIGSFGILVMLSNTGFEVNSIDDVAGLNTRNPWMAFMMLIVMFSLAGIPPLVGFIAKLGVLEALIQVHMTWLAVIAILFAVIGSYYYIRVIKVMYFEEPYATEPLTCSIDSQVAMTINGIMILLLGIFPGELYALSRLVF